MNRVSITGSTGFVGKNLVPYLSSKQIDVLTISREELASSVNLTGVDVVIHLAGKAHDLKNAANPDEYYKVNFELTKNLYDNFLKSNANKFIFLSSVKAAADVVDGVLTEEMAPQPKTDYGKSKLMAEQYIQSQPLPEGKSYFILRPCMIHGPGNKGNLNLLYKFVEKGLPYPLAAFENKRSFLSIHNLCYIIEGLLKQPILSGLYQVADDEALSTNEIVSILSNSLHKKARLWHVSPVLIKGLAKFGDILNLPINSERLQKLTENYIVSNLKIKSALASDLPLSTKQGLKLTAKSFSDFIT